MATPTYTLIDSTVLGSSASSVTFSGISATGKGDLVLVSEVVDDATTSSPLGFLTFNGDNGTNYFFVNMKGNGSSASSSAISNREYIEILEYSPTNGRALVITQIMDYSATDKHKTVLNRTNNAASGVAALAGRWASTSAITSLTFDAYTSRQFDTGSSFYLYQIVSE